MRAIRITQRSDPPCRDPNQSFNKAFMIHAEKESRSMDDKIFPHLRVRVSTFVRSRSVQRGNMMLTAEQRKSGAARKKTPPVVLLAGMDTPLIQRICNHHAITLPVTAIANRTPQLNGSQEAFFSRYLVSSFAKDMALLSLFTHRDGSVATMLAELSADACNSLG